MRQWRVQSSRSSSWGLPLRSRQYVDCAVGANIQQDHGVAAKGQRTKYGVGEVLMVYDHLLDQFNHHRVIHGGEIMELS